MDEVHTQASSVGQYEKGKLPPHGISIPIFANVTSSYYCVKKLSAASVAGQEDKQKK